MQFSISWILFSWRKINSRALTFLKSQITHSRTPNALFIFLRETLREIWKSFNTVRFCSEEKLIPVRRYATDAYNRGNWHHKVCALGFLIILYRIPNTAYISSIGHGWNLHRRQPMQYQWVVPLTALSSSLVYESAAEHHTTECSKSQAAKIFKWMLLSAWIEFGNTSPRYTALRTV